MLVATPFIKDCIVDKDKTHLIAGAIAQGTSQYGMQTFDQSIFSLFQQELISYEEALRWASHVDEFKLKVQGISTTADVVARPDGQHDLQQAERRADQAGAPAARPEAEPAAPRRRRSRKSRVRIIEGSRVPRFQGSKGIVP